MSAQASDSKSLDIKVRPMEERDLDTADRIMRLAFGTFIGLPDPATFMGDANYVHTRWRANPAGAFVAEIDGEVVGSNFATSWGSVGFFGPLTTRPALWDRSIGKHLMVPIMECFAKWGTKHLGLYTFAQSPKHISLYQKFGFWPRFLLAMLTKPVTKSQQHSQEHPAWTRFSALPENEREERLFACRQLTDGIYQGLDVSNELRATANQKLGDTIMLWQNGQLAGMAVCHYGPGTEAGSGVCYIKFGAAQNAEYFHKLLDACGELAANEGLARINTGVNTACHEAYRAMLDYGYRIDRLGVAMQNPNEDGYNRPGVYILNDWR